MPCLSLEEIEVIRKRWENDIGLAAKDVRRLLEHHDSLIAMQKPMRDNLGSVQARCTELLNQVRSLRATLSTSGDSSEPGGKHG
jgi:uncharacterized coiled-coil DUF342 family protein